MINKNSYTSIPGRKPYPRTHSSVKVGIPNHTRPTGTAIVAVGLSLAASGSMLGTSTNPIPMLTLDEVTTPKVIQNIPDRRRRFETASQALAEIRLWTGFAWSTLAEILGVSRRAVHQWASGAEPAGQRADVLARLHNRAEELSAHGQSATAMMLAAEYRIDPRELRASPRKTRPKQDAILSAIHTPLSEQPVSLGVRKLRRKTQV